MRPQALLAAREIQRHCRDRNADIARRFGAGQIKIGVGIGIDSGDANFGEFGRSHRDLTVIGTVVNRAARAQAAAPPGEILVTEAVRARNWIDGDGCRARLRSEGLQNISDVILCSIDNFVRNSSSEPQHDFSPCSGPRRMAAFDLGRR
jgi:Adenylate and Guanylate cyclase catalytic domain